MNCPECKSDMQIEDSRKYNGLVRRKRRCVKCGHTERTIEVFGDAATTADGWKRDRVERDRAIGALGILVFDGVISMGRMRELMDMGTYQQSQELLRVLKIS